MTGIPCKHAVSAICTNRDQPETFIHKFFSKENYLAIYQHVIHPVPSEEEWERISYPDIHPNIIKKPAGRPKTKRIRKLDELRNPFEVIRAGGYVVCGNY